MISKYRRTVNSFYYAAKAVARLGDQAQRWYDGAQQLMAMHAEMMQMERLLRDVIRVQRTKFQSRTAQNEALARVCRRAVQYLAQREKNEGGRRGGAEEE